MSAFLLHWEDRNPYLTFAAILLHATFNQKISYGPPTCLFYKKTNNGLSEGEMSPHGKRITILSWAFKTQVCFSVMRREAAGSSVLVPALWVSLKSIMFRLKDLPSSRSASKILLIP